MQYMEDNSYRSPIIMSPPLPNGVTFLTNILLELRIPIYSYYFELFWKTKSDHLVCRPYTQKAVHNMMPSFTDNKRLKKTTSISMDHQHDWPFLEFKDRKVILFVRDGRDGIFSNYKRYPTDTSFGEYLTKPTPPFNLPHTLNWGLFHLLWLEFLSIYCEYIVVRFEDIKGISIAETENILSFLNINRTQEEIAKAVDNSSIVKARKVSEKAESDKEPNYIRRGKVFEWKESWSPENLQNLPYTFLRASDMLGYEGLANDRQPASTEEHPLDPDECARLAETWFSEVYPTKLRKTPEGEKLYHVILAFIEMEPALRRPDIKTLIYHKPFKNPDPDEHNMEYQMRRLLKYYKVRSVRKPLIYLKYSLMNALGAIHKF